LKRRDDCTSAFGFRFVRWLFTTAEPLMGGPNPRAAMMRYTCTTTHLPSFRIPAQTQGEIVLQLARRRGAIRARALEPLGIPRAVLSRLVARGELIRVDRGLYVHPEADLTEHHTLAEVLLRVPHAVVNLLSALAFHGLTTEQPHAVWIALPRNAQAPRLDYPPLQLTWAPERLLQLGVDIHEIEGIPVPITSPARTVADCFKFRSRVGLEVAIEALRDYRRAHRTEGDALWAMARQCRVATVMRPYLEAIP